MGNNDRLEMASIVITNRSTSGRKKKKGKGQERPDNLIIEVKFKSKTELQFSI